MVRLVRPWKPFWKQTTPGRPVAARAILTAFSTASAPELTNMVRLGVSPGAFSLMRAASRMYDSQGNTLMDVWANLSICAWAAATTLGCECPTFITPMPPAKSMNSLPSVSVMIAFFA